MGLAAAHAALRVPACLHVLESVRATGCVPRACMCSSRAEPRAKCLRGLGIVRATSEVLACARDERSHEPSACVGS
jgi:hypothetical protein